MNICMTRAIHEGRRLKETKLILLKYFTNLILDLDLICFHWIIYYAFEENNIKHSKLGFSMLPPTTRFTLFFMFMDIGFPTSPRIP